MDARPFREARGTDSLPVFNIFICPLTYIMLEGFFVSFSLIKVPFLLTNSVKKGTINEQKQKLSLVKHMFLYIGNGQVIDGEKIVMIIDVRKANRGQFPRLRQKTKAAIVLRDGSFHLSKISARSLGKRIERWGGE